MTEFPEFDTRSPADARSCTHTARLNLQEPQQHFSLPAIPPFIHLHHHGYIHRYRKMLHIATTFNAQYALHPPIQPVAKPAYHGAGDVSPASCYVPHRTGGTTSRGGNNWHCAKHVCKPFKANPVGRRFTRHTLLYSSQLRLHLVNALHIHTYSYMYMYARLTACPRLHFRVISWTPRPGRRTQDA